MNVKRQRPRGLHGRVHALDGEREVVDRAARVTGRVLDGAAHDAALGSEPDHLRRLARRVCVPVLEVAVDGQVGRRRDGAAVVQHLAPADGVSLLRIHRNPGVAEVGSGGIPAPCGGRTGIRPLMRHVLDLDVLACPWCGDR
jgi:hypothetical protein